VNRRAPEAFYGEAVPRHRTVELPESNCPRSLAMTHPSTLSEPGAVRPNGVHPLAWWIAGGLGVLGAGALAAALSGTPGEPAAPVTPTAATTSTTATAKPQGKAVPAKSTPRPVAEAAAVCAHCGTVQSVTTEKHKGEGTGLGAVGGAVIGGVVGHQVGDGNGRKAMTVLGAVGGGLAGHEIEKRARATTTYQVQLRMDDGSSRTVSQATAPAVGARFEVQGSQLKPLPARGA
jgi:outer membrane lipoprotein SlyB